MRVSIPRSNPSRRDRTFALLVGAINHARPGYPFEGMFLRCGSIVDASELRPKPEFPEVPLLIEFAGSDGTGRGHNRSPDVHVLWRFDRAASAFEEIARVKSRGAEWVVALLPIVERELNPRPVVSIEAARLACARVMRALDQELAGVPAEARIHVVTLVYDGVAARLVA